MPAHAAYLKQLCTDFKQCMINAIDRTANDVAEIQQDALCFECIKHLQFANHRGNSFLARDREINKIREYLQHDSFDRQSKSRKIFTVHGAIGSGKTVVLAKAVVETYHMSKIYGNALHNATIVLRFIGTTAGTTSSRLLMQSICAQLAHVYGKTEKIPTEYPKLVTFFRDALCTWPTKTRPAVLLFDALDHLSNEDNGQRLTWLPMRNLTEHLWIVVTAQSLKQSGLSRDHPRCLGSLLTVLQPELEKDYDENNNANFLEIAPMTREQGEVVLAHWLKKGRRQLTSEQTDYVLNKFLEDPKPLYLKLAFQVAVRWASYDTGDKLQIASGLQGIIFALFRKLEVAYGKSCVSHALGFITAAKVGLSEAELEDILSCDEAVLNEVYQWWLPPVRRLPPLLWARMRDDLGSLLIVRVTAHDQIRVFQWFHSCVRDAALDRYLRSDVSPIFHVKLANYFMGTWSEDKKPFHYAENQLKIFAGELERRYENDWDGIKAGTIMAQEHRKAAKQPLYFDNNGMCEFNHRKLHELPYQLARCGPAAHALLAERCLCNYDFLLAKLRATSVPDVIADFIDADECGQNPVYAQPEGYMEGKHDVLSELPKSKYSYQGDDLTLLRQIQLIGDVIRLGAHVLAKDREQLAVQLLGRVDLGAINAKCGKATALTTLIDEAMDKGDGSLIPHILTTNATFPRAGGSLIKTFTGHSDRVISVDVMKNNPRVLLSGSFDKTAKLWDLSIGSEFRTFSGHNESVTTAKISEDGRYILTLSYDFKIRVWEVATGALSYTYTGHKLVPNAVVQIEKDTYASGANDKQIKIWQAGKGTGSATLSAIDMKTWVHDLAYRKSHNQLISANQNGSTQLWSVDKGSMVKDFRGHEAAVLSCELLSDDKRILTCSRDCMTIMWDIDSGAILKRLVHHVRAVNRSATTTDMKYTVTASDDKTLGLWDLESGELVRSFVGHARAVSDCTLFPNGETIASASEDNTIRLWKFDTNDMYSGHDEHTLVSHAHDVTRIAVSSDGNRVYSSSTDRSIKVWDVDGKCVGTISGDSGVYSDVTISPCNQYLAVASGDYTSRVWNSTSGNEEAVLLDTGGLALCCQFHPDGERLLFGCSDNTVKVWRWRKEKMEKRFGGHHAPVTSLAVCPGGRFFISGSQDHTAIYWDLGCFVKMWVYEGHSAPITCVAALSNGRGVLTASADCTARLWDSWKSRELTRFGVDKSQLDTASDTHIGHTDIVTAVEASPDCVYLVTCSNDASALLWDLQTGQQLCAFGIESKMLCGTWFPTLIDGRRLVVFGGSSGEVQFATIAGGRDLEATIERQPNGQSTKRKLSLYTQNRIDDVKSNDAIAEQQLDRGSMVGMGFDEFNNSPDGLVRRRLSLLEEHEQVGHVHA